MRRLGDLRWDAKAVGLNWKPDLIADFNMLPLPYALVKRAKSTESLKRRAENDIDCDFVVYLSSHWRIGCRVLAAPTIPADPLIVEIEVAESVQAESNEAAKQIKSKNNLVSQLAIAKEIVLIEGGWAVEKIGNIREWKARQKKRIRRLGQVKKGWWTVCFVVVDIFVSLASSSDGNGPRSAKQVAGRLMKCMMKFTTQQVLLFSPNGGKTKRKKKMLRLVSALRPPSMGGGAAAPASAQLCAGAAVRSLHSSVAVLARFPTLYTRTTRRQAKYALRKEKRLTLKAAKSLKRKASRASPVKSPQQQQQQQQSKAPQEVSSHIQRIRDRANLAKRLALAASAHVAAGAKLAGRAKTILPPPSSSARPALVTPFLATVQNPTPAASYVRHDLRATLAVAKQLGADIPSSKASSANINVPQTATDDSNTTGSGSNLRSFKITSVANAPTVAKARVDTANGIGDYVSGSLLEAVKKIDLKESSPYSALAGPSFMYGITPLEAKSVLIDAPKHMEKRASESGRGAYETVDKSKTSAKIEPAEMAELLRRQISLENASQSQINKYNKKRIMEIFGRKEFDTGSPEVQAAVFTIKIKAMEQHLNAARKDKSSKRRLQAVVSKRASILKYLRRKNLPRFVETCRGLGVDPETIRA
ncbi:hypothetical protein HDU83_008353 [Entophlyctis luteolus]|nr:hypothetical protein HDU83_008353 [Entophlyctis luteolus]